MTRPHCYFEAFEPRRFSHLWGITQKLDSASTSTTTSSSSQSSVHLYVGIGIKQKCAKHLDCEALGHCVIHKKGDRTEAGKEQEKGGKSLLE